jgi:hypothetical protein
MSTELNKSANEIDADRIREIKGLAFTTALHTAGVAEDRVSELYDRYQTLDAQRESNLNETYNVLIGKEDS